MLSHAFSRLTQRCFATAQPAVLDRNMGQHQWYTHISRNDKNDASSMVDIKAAIKDLRAVCDSQNINLVIGMGPTFLPHFTNDLPEDFQAYETFKSIDGSEREAKGTQEELLFWMNSDRKDDVWKAKYDVVQTLEKCNMKVARETMTFIYGDSKDMTGFQDGTGNPDASRDVEVAVVPDGQPGAGGSHAIAQRWVHDLKGFNALSIEEQEGVFGRTKNGSERLNPQPAHSHLSHHELRVGGKDATGVESAGPKRDEMSRRSTPYAFHDGTVGLYFMGFCNSQAPLRERMEAMYGINGQVRDRLTDFSNPASGSFYFMPSVEVLDSN